MRQPIRSLSLFVVASTIFACNGERLDAHAPVSATLTPADAIVATAAVGTIAATADVDPDGNFTYAIPVQVPPGRGGVQPALALRYSSSGGESALGVGFSLTGVSAISRCARTFAQDGERRSVSLTDEDRFCLDGDRLVVEPGSTYGAPAARYRPATDALRRVRELPRDSAAVAGPAGFLVELPDGRRREYGATANARVEVPLASGRVAETWLLQREYDLIGNLIEYQYQHVTPSGHRLGSDVVVGDLVRISSIVYTGFRVDADTIEAGDRRVDFVYAALPRRASIGEPFSPDLDPGAASGGGLIESATPSDGFRHGVLWWAPSVFPLERIVTSVAGQWVHEYRLRGGEDPRSHRYRLDSVQLCTNAPPVTAADHDTTGAVCLPPTRFGWRERSVGDRGPNAPTDSVRDPRYDEATFQRWDMVFNRFVGRPRFQCSEPGSNPTPWLAFVSGIFPFGATGEQERWCHDFNPVFALDANGDGADDLMYRAAVNNYDEFRANVRWGRPSSRLSRSLSASSVPFQETTFVSIDTDGRGYFLPNVDESVEVIDWNTDGLDDVIAYLETVPPRPDHVEIAALISDGTGNFEAVGSGLELNFWSDSEPWAFGVEFLDLNGDGRKDVAFCEVDPSTSVDFGRHHWSDFDGLRGHWAFALRTDSGFEAPTHTESPTECAWEYGRALSSNFDWDDPIRDRPTLARHPVVADFDGDGAEELLIAEPYESGGGVDDSFRRVLRWDSAAGTAVVEDTNVRGGDWIPVDLNGDGNHDLVSSHWHDRDASRRLIGCVPGLSDPQAACLQRAISMGDGTRFAMNTDDPYLPLRRRVRTSTHGSTTSTYRVPLRMLGFDLNGDGRGDLLASTLPRNGTNVFEDCDPNVQDCANPWDGWFWRWEDEEIWTLDSLSSHDLVEYPTTAVLDALRRTDDHAWWNPSTIALDGDGDGALDLLQYITRDKDAGEWYRTPMTFFHNVRSEPPLIESIVDGLGARREILYRNLSDPTVYTPGRSCTYPQRCVTSSRIVVAGTRDDDGLLGTRERAYQYEDGRVDLEGGGWIGFARVLVRDSTSGVTVETKYDNETRDASTGTYPRARSPHLVRTWRSATPDPETSTVFEGTVVTTERVTAHPIAGVVQVRTQHITEERYESTTLPSAGMDPFAHLSPERTRTIEYDEFDVLGFPSVSITTEGSATRTVRTDWVHDTVATWQVGRVDRRRTQMSTGATGCDRDQTEDFDYDWAIGRLITSILNDTDPATRVRTTYQFDFDRFHNLAQVETVADGETRTVTVAWDGTGYFPTATTNALGHETFVHFEPTRGLLYETVDPNGISSTRQFDGFSRPRTTWSELGPASEVSYERSAVSGVAYDVRTTSNVAGAEVISFDRLGRPIARETRLRDAWSRTDLAYDHRGRVAWVTEPHDPVETNPPQTTYHYDELDRIRRVESPIAGRAMEFSYKPGRTIIRNALGHTWERVEDERGLLANVIGPDELVGTSYTYCAAGELRSVTDVDGNHADILYDALGRRVTLIDPDAGTSHFAYDAWGQPQLITDSEQRKTSFTFDALGRMVERWRESDGVVDTWEWDTALLPNGSPALGLLHYTLSGDGVRDEIEYGDLGRVKWTHRTIDGETLSTGFRYDDLGRLEFVEHPTLFSGTPVVVQYHHDDDSGQITAVTGNSGEQFWRLVDQSARALPRTELIGSIERSTSYGPTGEVESIQSHVLGDVLQDLTYQYDARGLLTFRADSLTGREETFVHDPLGRVHSISEEGNERDYFKYSSSGNLEFTHDAEIEYPLPGEPRPHGARRISYSDGTEEELEYNDAGEVLMAGTLQLEHNQLGLPRHAWGPSGEVTFDYDSSGARARRVTDKSHSVWYSGAWERESTDQQTVERVMISTPAGVVAQVETVSDGWSTERRTRWLLADAQGSVETSMLDGEGPKHHRYDAFGGVLDEAGHVTGRAPSDDVRSGYTGHEHDADLGIINMGGRWYHPRLRRFLSPDPLSGGDSQRLNRYSYVRNSPFALIDPTGWDETWIHAWTMPARPTRDGRAREIEGWYNPSSDSADTSAPSDSGTAETAGAGAAGQASNSDATAPLVTHIEGPRAGARLHVPPGYGEPAGRDLQEAMVSAGGFAAGAAEAVVTGVVGLGVAAGTLVFAPPVFVVGALYLGYATLTGLDEAYDGFLETFEKASVPNAPLEYHFEASRALGGLVGQVWAGPIIEAGFALAVPRIAALATPIAEQGAVQGAVRGINDLGGVVSSVENPAGGLIVTAQGRVRGGDFAGHVNTGLMRGGPVDILTGVHGSEAGVMRPDAALLAEDLATWGGTEGVNIHDIALLSVSEISAMLEGPGTTIGAFCNSGACLRPLMSR